MRNHIAVVAALLIGLAACGRSDKDADLPPASGEGAPAREKLPPLSDPAEPVVSTTTTNNDTIGTTFPIAKADVAPNTSGVLRAVYVEEGDVVDKGDKLFQLRTQDSNLRISQAKAGVEAATANLAAIKVEYDRTKRLFDKNAINRAAWDQVQAQYEAATIALKQAKVGLRMARQSWSDATVRSPLAGIVTRKLKNAGEVATMMPPSIVVVIEDHTTLELRFRLPEKALKKLTVGDVYVAEFEALDVARDATVARIAPNVDAQTRTVEVIATIDNASGDLKAGMLAKVKRKGAKEAAAQPKKAAAGPKEAAR